MFIAALMLFGASGIIFDTLYYQQDTTCFTLLIVPNNFTPCMDRNLGEEVVIGINQISGAIAIITGPILGVLFKEH